jgi:hypothetical protein
LVPKRLVTPATSMTRSGEVFEVGIDSIDHWERGE